jgi:hypothetical protein
LISTGRVDETLNNIPLFLADTGVDCGAGEVALAEKLVELGASNSRLDEDDDLVELQAVEKVVELAVLLLLVKLHVVLLQTVQRQLLLVIDVYLERVLHELLAYDSDFLVQRGGEHHHLLVLRSGAEDGLDVVAHVYERLAGVMFGQRHVLTRLVEHLVTLIEDKVLEVGEAQVLVADEGVDTTGCADDDVRVGVLVAEHLDILLHRSSSVEDSDPHFGQELGEAVVLVSNLVGQLTGVAHDEDGRDTGLGLLVHLLESRKNEDGSLSETGLGLAEDIVSENGLRDGNLLDCGAQIMSEWVLKWSHEA